MQGKKLESKSLLRFGGINSHRQEEERREGGHGILDLKSTGLELEHAGRDASQCAQEPHWAIQMRGIRGRSALRHQDARS